MGALCSAENKRGFGEILDNAFCPNNIITHGRYVTFLPFIVGYITITDDAIV